MQSDALFPVFFFFNDTATTEIYTLSLHDALPILLPCVRQNSRSRSSGVSTWRPMMMSLMLGAYSAMVLMTFSPKASFCSSQVPWASLYGAYCTKQESTCLPGGATLGSVTLGITISM